jgi:hypothetical protein
LANSASALVSATIILMPMSILIVKCQHLCDRGHARLVQQASGAGAGICPNLSQKSPKMGIAFSLQRCKKEAVKILGTLPDCKFNLRKG